MPYTNNHGIRIHYQVEGTGPALVLQHGFTSSLEAFRRFGYTTALKDRYRLVLPDARGHGLSDKPHDAEAYTLATRVGDIVAILDDLNVSKAHFWGYSMGGVIGFGMAKHAADRVQSLIIGGAHPYADPIEAFRQVDGKDSQVFVKAVEQFIGEPLTPELLPFVLANDLEALAAVAQPRPSMEDVLPAMTMPCLLYVGTADRRYPFVKKCVERMPNAQLFEVPGCSHLAAYVHAARVLPRAQEFLTSM